MKCTGAKKPTPVGESPSGDSTELGFPFGAVFSLNSQPNQAAAGPSYTSNGTSKYVSKSLSTEGQLNLVQMFQVGPRPLAFSGQDVAPLAAPDHEGDHGQGEENRDEDENGERIVGRVHKHHLSVGAVREKVLVYADDVALHQWIGPVAVHKAGLCLGAQCEEVVLAEGRKRGMRGNSAATCGKKIYVGTSACIEGKA